MTTIAISALLGLVAGAAAASIAAYRMHRRAFREIAGLYRAAENLRQDEAAAADGRRRSMAAGLAALIPRDAMSCVFPAAADPGLPGDEAFGRAAERLADLLCGRCNALDAILQAAVRAHASGLLLQGYGKADDISATETEEKKERNP